MATSGELIRVIAATTGAPNGRVVSAHRYLHAAGLITQGGRGNSAARMTYVDAARIITAVAMADEIKGAAETWSRYSDLVAHTPLAYEQEGRDVVWGRSFGEALADLLEAVPANRDSFGGDAGDWIAVSIYGPEPRAKIEISRRPHTDTPLVVEYENNWKHGDPRTSPGDLKFIAQFSQITLGFVGEAIAGPGTK